jgi:hypothetical protein
MKRLTIVTGVAALITASASAQVSAWLPYPNEFILTPSYTYQTFDKFWLGRTKVELPDDVQQHTPTLTLEYGIDDRLAVDATVGYVWVDTTHAFGPGNNNDDGLTDTTFGLRYKFLDQDRAGGYPLWPSVALRVGGIIEGTYDENLPFSAGDGASGVETSLLLAKEICPNFGLYGDFGYRWRNQHVPDDLFGSAGAYATWYGFTLTGAYRHIGGLHGKNIGEVPFPQVKEIIDSYEIGLGYRDSGDRYYQFFFAHAFDGRNTGAKDVFGVSASFSFGR